MEKILKRLEDILLHMWMYHKWRSYDVWFLKHKAQPTVFCHFGYFLPFDSPNNLKNQNFEKMEKTPGYIIILQLCTIIENHDVWFLRYEAQQTIFCLFLNWDSLHDARLNSNCKAWSYKKKKHKKIKAYRKSLLKESKVNMCLLILDFKAI